MRVTVFRLMKTGVMRSFVLQVLSYLYNSGEVTLVADRGASTEFVKESDVFRIERPHLSPISLAKYIKDLRTFKKLVGKNKNDEVALFLNYSPLNMPLFKIMKRRHRIVYIHDPRPHSDMKKLRKYIYDFELKTYVNESDIIIVSSKAMQDILLEDYPAASNKTTVINLGTNEDHKWIGPKLNRTIDVLFYGAFNSYKGVDILVDAAEMLEGEAEITIVGKDDLLASCQNRDSLPENCNRINRYVSDSELAELLASSKCVVVPYRDATSTHVISSAFENGTPVIGTNVGSLSEYIDPGVAGIVVPPDDPIALANAIRLFLNNEDMRVSLSEGAIARSDTYFSNERNNQIYMRLVRGVM